MADGSKPRKAINQAGKSAMSPTSQCCRGPQLETHLLRYGIAAAVPDNPRTPRTMENLIISSCANLTALEVVDVVRTVSTVSPGLEGRA
jgi:hypothetical protein